MPVQEMLVLAVTHMLGGVCVAGMTTDPDAMTGLRWVRPVRGHGHVLLGDLTTPQGAVVRPFDVVTLNLLRPHPVAPHVEDWLTDFSRPRVSIVRRLEGERRTRFLQQHLDLAPAEALDGQARSLCLLRPDWIQGACHLDAYSGKLDARIGFGLDERHYVGAHGGLPVTDVKWRAFARSWAAECGGSVEFTTGDLRTRLGMHELVLAIGLSRPHLGACWPMVIGVHTVPDFDHAVDYHNL